MWTLFSRAMEYMHRKMCHKIPGRRPSLCHLMRTDTECPWFPPCSSEDSHHFLSRNHRETAQFNPIVPLVDASIYPLWALLRVGRLLLFLPFCSASPLHQQTLMPGAITSQSLPDSSAFPLILNVSVGQRTVPSPFHRNTAEIRTWIWGSSHTWCRRNQAGMSPLLLCSIYWPS